MEVEDLESGFLVTIFAPLPSGMSGVSQRTTEFKSETQFCHLLESGNPRQVTKSVGFHKGLLLE